MGAVSEQEAAPGLSGRVAAIAPSRARYTLEELLAAMRDRG